MKIRYIRAQEVSPRSSLHFDVGVDASRKTVYPFLRPTEAELALGGRGQTLDQFFSR